MKTDPISVERLKAAARALRVLAHPQRLRIVEALEADGEKPVRALVEHTGLPQAAVSHHLARMRAAGLVAAERRGKEMYYRVANPSCATILDCIRKRTA
jgi:DNA-binding transcriptional ArsR family regulator